MTHVPRIKICCIASPAEADLAISLGADILGFVAEPASGPGVVTSDAVRSMVRKVPPGVNTFLLTLHTTAPEIADQVAFCGTDSVQLVQHLDPAEHERLATLMPRNIRRIQVIHVEDDSVLDLIDVYTPFIDAFLLDSGRPNAAVPDFGGTGRTHDWSISRDFVRRSARPVFLAGGLNAANVGDAIERVDPFGLDLCSGVRSDGHLDEAKLRAYFDAARARSRDRAKARAYTPRQA